MLIQAAQKATAEHRAANDISEEVSLDLPSVSVDSIHDIYLILSNADVIQRDSFRTLLCKNVFFFLLFCGCNSQEYAYLHDLLNVFPQLEEQHKQDSLTELYDICHLICGLIERT